MGARIFLAWVAGVWLLGSLWAIDYELVEEGPWGDLESRAVDLIPSEELLRFINLPSEVTQWVFPGGAPQAVEQELRRLGVGEEFLGSLMDENERLDDGEQLRLFPDGKFLVQMEPEVRSRVYRWLGNWPENQMMANPVVVEGNARAAWLRGLGLPEGLVKVAEMLCYQQGQSLLFSDFPVLLSQANSGEEETLLVNGLAKGQTLKLRLRVDAEMDWAKLKSYWSCGGINDQCLPLLESIEESNTMATIDVEQLLPRWPRKFLHTYPKLVDGMSGRYPDSIYSSLNFFQSHPVPIYVDSPGVMKSIEAKYRVADRPYRFGDVMLLLNERGELLHGCVYVAENVVFTKNRSSVLSPWVMSRVSDMISHHSFRGATTIRVMRDRRIPEAVSEQGILPATGIVVP